MQIKHYEFEYGQYGETLGVSISLRGYHVLRYNYISKGTAFTMDERVKLKLNGYLPPRVKTLAEQIHSSLDIIDKKDTDIEKFIYIRSLYDRNVVLAHAVIASDVIRFLPIIYTPTVGLACQLYSTMFRKANGIHLYPGNIDQAEDILRNYTAQDIRVAVVTDNQGILGIGDQGAGGMPICLGKLMLYTQGAGIAPWHCLPISLDVGTDNNTLLDDPNYLGHREARLTGQAYDAFIDKFVTAFKRVFPNALCQWEDFSKQTAFDVRDKYLDTVISFNDDIQGTGSIALAGILAAMKVKKEKMTDQVYLIHGAGAGGIGIAEQIQTELMEQGMDEKEADARIFTLDSRGVVTSDRDLEAYKIKFAKDPEKLTWLKKPEDNTLVNVVKNEKVTVLIGTSGQPGCFTKEVVEAVGEHTHRPVVLPLSNPTTKTEALPKDIYEWTDGKALVATGSPFDPVEHNGKSYRIGQMNNAFVFPGAGLGIVASGATCVLPVFFSAAAHAVAEFVNEADIKDGILCPPLDQLKEVSLEVARRVGAEAIKAGVTRNDCPFSTYKHNNDLGRLNLLIDKMRWHPEYF
ncbi:malate dehydrogenase (oxaloacetate-decarboxylating) [Desulfocicer vacuolatum DSM 3385]|uniref:Malate dehydrogenase (Oxaloacetate-decarboxylating) n=1 Tax=Desulfocicer vacuolatum DSM 3385 TaxID=1121400 RepID=A0A1W1ZWW1_9BACT|nr:NAD-dependent malic enzyme [Desulfocicer vacuolatum]SMC52897.1 malate dehydrogenase (oxaloacetate-decarboxylating) [Desulfocicer vacuolatum DSM 3385]